MAGGATADTESYLLIGDSAALAAIARKLANLSSSARAIVVAETATPQARPAMESAADVTVHWVYRDTGYAWRTLNEALKGLFLPQDSLKAWIACDTGQADLIREQLVDDHGVRPQHISVLAW